MKVICGKCGSTQPCPHFGLGDRIRLAIHMAGHPVSPVPEVENVVTQVIHEEDEEGTPLFV